MTRFSDPDLEIMLRRFEERKIKKKTNLLEAGRVSKEVYFVLEGCLRVYYEKDGVDISAYFFTEDMFAGAYDSFTSKEPSRHSIEAIESSHLLVISYDNLQKLYQELPAMNALVRTVLEERFFALHQLFTSQILDTPEERYLNLIKERPNLLKRIPQHQIATFLGITPVSLSRIRSRVAKSK